MHTEEETAYDDDFNIDNLPFVHHSQPSTTTGEMPENMCNNLYEQSSSKSVEVSNAQHEKYNLLTDTTLLSTHNNESSSIPKDQNSSRQLHEHFIQHFPQTVSNDTHLDRTCEEDKEYENQSQPIQPMSSTLTKSTDGTYSLLAHNMKLSNL